MYRYTLRIRIGESFQDLTFQAIALGFAIQQAEAQFGKGSFLGCLSEDYIG